MSHFLRIEMSRYQRTILMFGATAILSVLVGLYFFTIVGQFDDSPDSAILRQPNTVFSLALTVSFCVLVLYGAVIYQRLIVSEYIGNRRIQLYTYPGGRSPLFLAKNAAFALAISGSTVVGLAVGAAVFLAAQTIVPVSDSRWTGHSWFAALALIPCITLLTLGATMVAGIVGVRRRSTVSTIATAVIIVVLLGNAVALSLDASPWVSWAVATVCVLISLSLLVTQNRLIQHDEVF